MRNEIQNGINNFFWFLYINDIPILFNNINKFTDIWYKVICYVSEYGSRIINNIL